MHPSHTTAAEGEVHEFSMAIKKMFRTHSENFNVKSEKQTLVESPDKKWLLLSYGLQHIGVSFGTDLPVWHRNQVVTIVAEELKRYGWVAIHTWEIPFDKALVSMVAWRHGRSNSQGETLGVLNLFRPECPAIVHPYHPLIKTGQLLPYGRRMATDGAGLFGAELVVPVKMELETGIYSYDQESSDFWIPQKLFPLPLAFSGHFNAYHRDVFELYPMSDSRPGIVTDRIGGVKITSVAPDGSGIITQAFYFPDMQKQHSERKYSKLYSSSESIVDVVPLYEVIDKGAIYASLGKFG